MVKKDREGDNSGLDSYEDGQYPFVLYNRGVLRHETNDEITHFRIIVRLAISDLYKRVACFKCRGQILYENF